MKPNRLKIALDLGDGKGAEEGARITVENKDRKVKLQSNWLHGAPARDLKARTTVTLTGGQAEFKGYDKFNFDDLNTNVSSEEITVFDGTLDAQSILRSQDGGATWSEVSTDHTLLGASRTRANTLFGTNSANSDDRDFGVSTDGGATWTTKFTFAARSVTVTRSS